MESAANALPPGMVRTCAIKATTQEIVIMGVLATNSTRRLQDRKTK
jgi:hypothetical protein